jgi:hypothetical protein
MYKFCMQLLLLLLLSSLEIGEKSPKFLSLFSKSYKSEKSTTTHFYFRHTENWKSPPFLKTVQGHESTAKFGSKLCATEVLKE